MWIGVGGQMMIFKGPGFQPGIGLFIVMGTGSVILGLMIVSAIVTRYQYYSVR